VWCGNNEPLAKEIADAMWGFWDDSGRNPKYMPCFHFSRNPEVKGDYGVFRDECQRAVGTLRRFICQLPTV
jgi:hypothetical protein